MLLANIKSQAKTRTFSNAGIQRPNTGSFIDVLGKINPKLKQKTLYNFNRINEIKNIRGNKYENYRNKNDLGNKSKTYE